MPKEASVRQFRKGTKSCVECRQRKLRCIPSDDDSQPCQNCSARGRRCVLQVQVGRTSESSGVTSRDRIASLEGSLNQLWTIVGDLRTELGHTHDAPSFKEPASAAEEDTESENSEMSPINPPAHLQQLFDNDFIDTQVADAHSSNSGSGLISSVGLAKIRARMQALIPSKQDIRAVCEMTMRWTSIYAIIFPTINKFNSMEDMLAQYDGLCQTDANPLTIAGLLLSVAITIVQQPELSTSALHMVDPVRWVRNVNDTVDETVLRNDNLTCSVEGIETMLLYIRLQLVKGQTRKLWLMLRRVMALAELIGLPRAARAHIVSQAEGNRSLTKPSFAVAATLWKSICSVTRLVGTMFNLTFGTTSYEYPQPQTIMADGKVMPHEFFTSLSVITSKVQDLDDAYIARRPEAELVEKAYRTDQELRLLSDMTPPEWWTLSPDSPLPEQVIQYWFFYFTVRTHLQLGLRQGSDSQHIHSYVTCYQASRAVAQRYVQLRGLLPRGFFAGRLIDLQALTGAAVLLFTSQRQSADHGVRVHDKGGPPASQLVHDVIQMMESVASQPTGSFAKQAAPSLRALDTFLNRPAEASSKDLTIHIPMLGKVNVSQHAKAAKPHSASNPLPPSMGSGAYQEAWQPAQSITQAPDLSTSGLTADDMLWSMDLMMDDFVPFPDDAYGGDQWLAFDSFNNYQQT